MQLYVMRHGETRSNVDRVFNGTLDEDINEAGVRQATQAGEAVSKIPLDLVVCSSMLRARHTASLANVNGVEMHFDDRLQERDYGNYTLHPYGEIDKNLAWRVDESFYETVETVPQMLERVGELLSELKQTYPDKNILIVTHNGIARILHAQLCGLPEDGNLATYGTLKNCEIRGYTVQG